MRRFLTKRRMIASGVTVALAVGIGTAAFAFITGGSGTGTGSATVTSSAPTAVTPSAAISGTIPLDGTATAVTITLSNGNPYSVQVASATVTINTSDSSWTTSGCPTDSFALGGSSSGSNYVVPPKVGSTNGTATVTGNTIHFVNSASEDQTGCVGFVVPLTTSAS